MKRFASLLVLIIGTVFVFSFIAKTDKPVSDNFSCISEDEQKLYDLIMEYRAQKNLPKIPSSKSLTIVAKTHAWDLQVNQPSKGKCNLHSWSDKGNWTKCCYTNDHAKAECMWSKPRELTNYTGNGYEISYWTSGTATPAEALATWKTSTGHNNVIINKDIWKTSTWKAIGIGIYESYAVVWFGELDDPDGNPSDCN